MTPGIPTHQVTHQVTQDSRFTLLIPVGKLKDVMPSIPAVACCPGIRSHRFNSVGVLGPQTRLVSTLVPVLKWFLVRSDSFVTRTL